MLHADWGRLWEGVNATMMEGVVVVDPKGIIQSVNDAMEKITGYGRNELIGHSCALIRCNTCFREDLDAVRKQCELFQNGVVLPSKCVIAKKDGRLLHVIKKATLIKDDKDQILGGLEIFLDVSEMVSQERLIGRLRRELNQENGFQGILGKSAVMHQLFSLISGAAQTDAPVIIYGESGTGKELVARAIHNLSSRRQEPYVRVNCKALDESLLGTELFGIGKVDGSDGELHRRGYFEAAHGGDIFLDEVGDMPATIQSKLLRVLCEKVIEREGARVPIVLDVRVIGATNQDLQQLVTEGRFREDLFYRLNAVPIHLPPLRQRQEDILLLAETFVERKRLKTCKPVVGFSKEALDWLIRYNWPGNVRELINAIEYAFMLCPEGNILPEHLPVHIISADTSGIRKDAASKIGGRARDKETLVRALIENGGKVTAAAKSLGVSRVTLWKWLKYHKIKVSDVL